MAVRIYSGKEVEKIRQAGDIAFKAHMHLVKFLREGVSTWNLDLSCK